ncbi:transmembrane 6 superfamily member 1 [Engraulis encrasicolus]|uniref:transmembrane 6 superfamily member 1 n=1 Tax=Engraulis encrasicolus TaxID=184585 RepID=UPI002FD1B5EA
MGIRTPHEVGVFVLSLTAPMVLYAMNNLPAVQEPTVILQAGAVVLLTVLLLIYLMVRNVKELDPLFYVFAELAFTSMVGLTNALEQDGYIKGFMNFYLKKGEPYLSTSYGIIMCYWDSIVHFILQLLMVRRISQRQSYRTVGLFWAGSFIAHQIVFIPGIVIGKYGSGILPAFWRNIPFLVLPVWAAVTLLNRPREQPDVSADEVEEAQSRSLLTRPIDLQFTLLLLLGMGFTLLRAFVVLDCRLDVCFTYIYKYEPYLKDGVAFPKVMMLAFLFYAFPLMAACVYGLNKPGCSWMLDWTLLFAGAMAQTQCCHIGGSLHSRTPFTYRVPSDTWRVVMALNIAYTAVPILLALRCTFDPAYFISEGQADEEEDVVVPEGKTAEEKKNQ